MTTAIHPEDLTTLSTDLERIEEDQVDVKFETVHRVTFLGVIELILKNPTRLHRLLRDQELQPQLGNRRLASGGHFHIQKPPKCFNLNFLLLTQCIKI